MLDSEKTFEINHVRKFSKFPLNQQLLAFQEFCMEK